LTKILILAQIFSPKPHVFKRKGTIPKSQLKSEHEFFPGKSVTFRAAKVQIPKMENNINGTRKNISVVPIQIYPI